MTDLAQRIKEINLHHDRLVRARGMLATRVARQPGDAADYDTVKAPGRRYGPTPLRLLLPQEGRSAAPLTSTQRAERYVRQRVIQGGAPTMSVTPRQQRRISRKRNRALGGLPNSKEA